MLVYHSCEHHFGFQRQHSLSFIQRLFVYDLLFIAGDVMLFQTHLKENNCFRNNYIIVLITEHQIFLERTVY